MYFAYVDESGSTGDVAKGGSKSYTLGCVLVRASQWATTFGGLINHRRFLTAKFGLLARAEVKANHLLQNAGAFRDLALSEHARYSLYRGLFRLCPKLDIKAFAIVIRKELVTDGNPHDIAWTFLFQRLERLARKRHAQVIVLHDEGDDLRIRALARRARNIETAEGEFPLDALQVPFDGLLEDPVSRRSHESQFLQMSDLVAYAAFRRVFPPPARRVQIVPESMWDELGESRLAELNQGLDGPSPGIVAWPPLKIGEPPCGGSKGRPTPVKGPGQSSGLEEYQILAGRSTLS
jgi:hypothetical protein